MVNDFAIYLTNQTALMIIKRIHIAKLIFYAVDQVLPFFNRTNMNETKVRNIDVLAEGHKTVILQCFADGMPKPTVTWYKVHVVSR